MSSVRDTAVLQAGDSPYNYIPTRWICATLLSLFALTTAIHIAQAARYRLWWLFPTVVLAGLLECLGWTGRLWSSSNAPLLTPFLMQICCTILAPTPLVAANFIILGRIIKILGAQYSRLSARMYTTVFLTCDIVALIVQGVGGGLASTAAQTGGDASRGGNVMLGGIIFQLAAIVGYVLLAGEFLVRYTQDRPISRDAERTKRARTTGRMRLMLLGMTIMTVLIVIRSIYRAIELANGWTGPVIRNETFFNVFDGAMILLAMFTLNALHPGFLLIPAETHQPMLDGGMRKDSSGSAGSASSSDTRVSAAEKAAYKAAYRLYLTA